MNCARTALLSSFGALVLSTSAGAAASGECTTNAPVAIACFHPMNAANAWHLYKSNSKAIDDSNNRQLIRESECTIIRGAQFPLRITLGPARVATNKGWTSIAMVTLREADNSPPLWIAVNYMSPACEASRVGNKVDGRDPTIDWREMGYPPLGR